MVPKEKAEILSLLPQNGTLPGNLVIASGIVLICDGVGRGHTQCDWWPIRKGTETQTHGQRLRFGHHNPGL